MTSSITTSTHNQTSDTPTVCIPTDPSVSGWWWLTPVDNDKEFPIWWEADEQYWYGVSDAIDAERAAKWWRVLGPVPSHAEYEALTAELGVLKSENARLRTEYDRLRFRLTATQIYTKGLEDDFPDMRIATRNILHMLGGTTP